MSAIKFPGQLSRAVSLCQQMIARQTELSACFFLIDKKAACILIRFK